MNPNQNVIVKINVVLHDFNSLYSMSLSPVFHISLQDVIVRHELGQNYGRVG